MGVSQFRSDFGRLYLEGGLLPEGAIPRSVHAGQRNLRMHQPVLPQFAAVGGRHDLPQSSPVPGSATRLAGTPLCDALKPSRQGSVPKRM